MSPLTKVMDFANKKLPKILHKARSIYAQIACVGHTANHGNRLPLDVCIVDELTTKLTSG